MYLVLSKYHPSYSPCSNWNHKQILYQQVASLSQIYVEQFFKHLINSGHKKLSQLYVWHIRGADSVPLICADRGPFTAGSDS